MTPAPLFLSQLRTQRMRNLLPLVAEFGPRFNVLYGDNGQGKTNLLEALYVLCTTRSFRAARLAELTAHTATEPSFISGDFQDGALTREQRVTFRAGNTLVRVDGKRPSTLAAYATLSPAVVFHPGELQLSAGPSSLRRKLLDRVALYMDPSSLHHAERYGRAQRERQRTLTIRGAGSPDLSAWEALMVEHGIAVMLARSRAADLLTVHAQRAFERIAAPNLQLAVTLQSTATIVASEYAAALHANRERDVRRGSASIGPHRDDLHIELDGHAARSTASQGQHRAIVLALKAGEISVIGQVRGMRPILLLDDVSSELDPERTAAFFGFLAGEIGQVFLTTTRRELIATGSGERSDFWVREGSLTKVS
jgi:DNA replication and repair protein RecF